MTRRLGLWILGFGLALAISGHVQAEGTPAATANQVSGPAVGNLTDKIELSLSPYLSNRPNLSNRDALTISFCATRTIRETVLLNGRYVPQSRVHCETPGRKLNQTGKRAMTGVTMTPDLTGEWRWRDDYTLTFKPKRAWPAGQPVQLRFDAGLFPDQVKLLSGSYQFTTEPLAPQITDMQFFQDPNDVEKRGVSASVRFNTPVAAEALKRHLRATLEEVSWETEARGLRKRLVAAAENMPFDLQLNEGGQQAEITVPLKVLPDKERFLKLEILPGLEALAGGQALPPGGPGRLEQRVQAPSRYSFARIQSVAAAIVKNDRHEPEQVLIITANVPVSAEEIGKHLQIRALPKDKPAPSPAYSPKKDYAWESAHEVSDAVLAAAPEVKFTVNPVADAAATMHSVKFEAMPGRWLHVRIAKGLEAKGGYILNADHRDTVQTPGYDREVKLLGDGALLALGGDRKISVYALGAYKLKFTASRIMTRDIAHLVSQSGGDFAKPEFRDWGFNEQNISENFTKEITLPHGDARKPQFAAFDFAPYLDANPGEDGKLFKDKPRGKGLFFLNVEAVAKDDKGQDFTAAGDRRFVLVSDLGLIVKTHRDGARTAFVQSVASGKPVSGAMIKVLGVNGLPVFRTETSRGGHAEIPDLRGLGAEKRPVAYLVRHDDDLAFMPVARADRTLDYSQFDTEGVHAAEDGLKAYLFSDRGIYRPGETAHIGIIVKQGDWTQDLSGLPLQLEITNPRGQVIDKQIVAMNAAGLVEHRFTTKDISQTGIYNVRLYMGHDKGRGNQLGSTSIRVEEFLPDAMKIIADFSKPIPKGWLKPDGLKATVNLQHLYGAPAVDHRVTGSLSIAPGSFAFKDYTDYQFFDPRRNDKSFEHPAGETQTDDEGNARFDLHLDRFGESTYLLTFNGEGFAQDSGRSVRTAKSVLISPLPYVVGMKPDGNLNYINKGARQTIHLLALDPDLQPVAADGLALQLMRIDYVSSLIKDERGAYIYRSVPKETMIAQGALDIPAGGLDYALDSANPGNYALVLRGNNGLVLSRTAYTIVGAGAPAGRARKDAVVTVKLDRAEYAPGTAITMNIVAPYAGAGLITLETDKVLTFKWFKAETPSSVQSITIPQDFIGKGFVNVEFVRALDSKEIYTAPLAFAVQPFYAAADAADSKINLTVPERIKPGSDLAVTYSTRTPGKIIIFAVDEGILQYGRYATPDPLGYFVKQRALQVQTAQILDLLMPEYGIMQQLSAAGGDGALADGKNLNPFKRKTLPPVAFWSGVVDADAEPRTLHYAVPEHFNGRLRVMAVAASGLDMGAAESRSIVKGDIIVSPNAPFFAAPGDEFSVGVAIANNIKGSGQQAKLKLTVTASEHLEILSGAAGDITIAEDGEAKTQIRVRAKSILGAAALNFTASAGDHAAHYEATMSVRPPAPAMTSLVSGHAEKGATIVRQMRSLYPEFAAIEASASSLPLSLIPGLARYLQDFPYGCTEQILSKAMPAVVLYGQKDLGGDSKMVEDNVLHVMSRLRELQNHRGGFGTWHRGGGQADDFVSLYALHYMTLAKEKRLPVPDDTFRAAQDYAKTLVNRSPSSLQQARHMAYGVYLLTRNGEVTANYLPNLLRYLDGAQKNAWKNDLAAVYIAAAYRLMQLVPEGNALLDEFALGDPVVWDNNPHYWGDDEAFYNNLNRYAQYLSIVAAHFPERLPQLDRNILFRIAGFIGEGSYNTLSSSYAIMAFSDYGAAAMQPMAAGLAIGARKDQEAFALLPLTGDQIKRAQVGIDRPEIRFSGGGDQGLFYQIAASGYDKLLPSQPVEDGLEIARHYLNQDREPVKEVKIGQTIEAVITMRAHGDRVLTNMAVVDLLPAGFEIVPESVLPIAAVQDAAASDDAREDVHDNGDENGSANRDDSHDDQAMRQWTPQMVDMREDRVIGFGTIPPEPVVWRYKLKAVNSGTFTTPPAYAESMYNRALKARGATGTMTVQ